jgi:hypothetical protein
MDMDTTSEAGGAGGAAQTGEERSPRGEKRPADAFRRLIVAAAAAVAKSRPLWTEKDSSARRK